MERIENQGFMLAMARKAARKNQDELAAMLGVSRRTVQNWEAGKPISSDKVADVVAFMRNYTSDLSPVIEQEVRPYTTNGHGVRFYEQQDGQILMQTPIVQFDALGSPEDDYTELVASREEGELSSWIVDSVHQGKYYSFVVDNDSMDDGSRDSFQKGDMVLVRELDKQDWLPHLYINKWRFWVVCFGNCIRIKEIVAQDMEAGTITLHSLNPSPEYTDFTLRLDQVNRLFNVVQLQPKKRVF